MKWILRAFVALAVVYGVLFDASLITGIPKSLEIALLPASKTYQLGRQLITVAIIVSAQLNSGLTLW